MPDPAPQYSTASRQSTPMMPTMPTMPSMSVQLMIVSFNDRLKYSLAIQKPESLTCENIKLPAPTASTMRFGSTPPAATTGAIRLAAVMPATVAEPSDTRITPAISQPSTSGSIEMPVSRSEMFLSTPVATNTSL